MSRWIILRTSGPQTLPLMRSLRGAGFEVWTLARTVRRSVPAKTLSGKRVIEVDAPILPTFVFAAEGDLEALALAAAREVSPHPGFRVFHHGGRVPLVGNAEIAGLREEEADKARRSRRYARPKLTRRPSGSDARRSSPPRHAGGRKLHWSAIVAPRCARSPVW